MGIVGRRRGGTVLFLRSGGRHGRRGKGTVKKCGGRDDWGGGFESRFLRQCVVPVAQPVYGSGAMQTQRTLH